MPGRTPSDQIVNRPFRFFKTTKQVDVVNRAHWGKVSEERPAFILVHVDSYCIHAYIVSTQTQANLVM